MCCIENRLGYCAVCTLEVDEDKLLICDKCDFNMCHTYCMDLDSVPEGEWLCPWCENI